MATAASFDGVQASVDRKTQAAFGAWPYGLSVVFRAAGPQIGSCGFPEAVIRRSTDTRDEAAVHSHGMTVQIDIAEVGETLAKLHANEAHRSDKSHRSIAVVVPLTEGRCDVIRDFIEEGPPFDPEEIGLTGHKVFLTEREAIFVFETEAGLKALERILAEPELWEVLASWEHCAKEEPRLATAVYEWPKPVSHQPRRGDGSAV